MNQLPDWAALRLDVASINESLLQGALRQHELTEAANSANALLQGEIVERKQAEEALRQTHNALALKTKELTASLATVRATLDSATDGILVVDFGNKITNFNAKFVAMWKISREILEVGDNMQSQELASEQFDDPQQFLLRIEEISGLALPESFDVLELTDGRVFERYSKLLVSNNPSQGRVWNFRDITEHKIAERNLKKAKDEAERANKAKDDFLAVLSHELRTPLTPVFMMTTALCEDERLPQEVRQQLGMMQRNIALETRLIDDLLDITYVSRGKLKLHTQTCDAHSLISLALEIVRDEVLTKQISIERQFTAINSGLTADAARFQQIIWNLLRNAVKFTPRGGKISVRTSNQADWLHIEVTDSGIGIEPAAFEKIFQPFEQGHLAGNHLYGGVGLGLAIAKAVVDLHGGKIGVHSKGSNQGATFTIKLPGAFEPPYGTSEMVVDSKDSTSPSLPSKTNAKGILLRILLVEDHAPTLQVISNLLARDGHQIVTAGSVADALNAAAANPLDLVVSDLGLPDGTGNFLMEKLRADYGLRGIALSGYGMEEDVTRSREAGFVTHLIKPVPISELRRVINNFRNDTGENKKKSSN
jgi:signal transduction histidine kinase/CheY-like chemotaxis protein